MKHTILSGNLTKDPEIVGKGGEWKGFKFSIANNDERTKNINGEFEEYVSFFDLIFWTKNDGHWSMKLKKGTQICAECEPRQDRWETEDGQKRSKISFKVLKFPFIGERHISQQQQEPQQQPTQTPPAQNTPSQNEDGDFDFPPF